MTPEDREDFRELCKIFLSNDKKELQATLIAMKEILDEEFKFCCFNV